MQQAEQAWPSLPTAWITSSHPNDRLLQTDKDTGFSIRSGWPMIFSAKAYGH